MDRIKSVALSVLILGLLSSCGAGGGGLALSQPPGGGGGIGGSGVTSSGTIDGFGSIFVNGVEFETTEAEVSLDGEGSTAAFLRLGMVVTVSGTVNDDGRTGDASSVRFDSDVEGPITAIVAGQDGDSALLVVLGVEVIVERTGTVFDGVSFDSLAINDLIEVSGFPGDEQRLRATRVEKISDFVAGTSEIEVQGLVNGLSQTEFSLGDFVVDFSGADLSKVTGSSLVEGMLVEVRGTLEGSRITADRIAQQDDISADFDNGDAISVQGTIANYASPSQFKINGVAINASNAAVVPADLVLANGIIVQVEGEWNGGVLVARNVEARRGSVEVEARVASASAADNTVTLQLFGGTLTVQVDSRTLLDDDTNRVNSLKVSDIVSGDFLEVEAIQVGSALLATRIDRDDPDDDILQAPIESFEPGSSITLLGITYSTAGARFESQNDSAISEQAFFGEIEIGDLVKVKDNQLADGIADEVEFERDTELDGGSEFDDDDGSDDDGSDDGSDDDDSEDNSGSGSGEDTDDEESDDNSGSGSGDDPGDGEDPEDNSGSGGSGSG